MDNKNNTDEWQIKPRAVATGQKHLMDLKNINKPKVITYLRSKL